MIVVADVKKDILSTDNWDATEDYALFHINERRSFRDINLFDECSFIDLYICHKTVWEGIIPSTFQTFMPRILEVIMPKDNTIVLSVVDTAEQDDFRYLFIDDFIKTFLSPKGYDYSILKKKIGGECYSVIFFECPLMDLQILDEIAYPGTFTAVEGFVIEKGNLPLFSKWHEMGNTDVMFRDLVKKVYMAFRMWTDKNGMFIVTDKLNIPLLEEKVQSSGILKEIEDYVQQQ